MKIELSTYEAANILLKDEHANWSHNAALALIEYYESIENECGEPIDLDIVAIRCDWSEYKNAVEAAKDYSELKDSEQAALEYFRDRTNVITFDGGILIQQF